LHACEWLCDLAWYHSTSACMIEDISRQSEPQTPLEAKLSSPEGSSCPVFREEGAVLM